MTTLLAETATAKESYAYCRSVARRAARNFYFAFLTLPPRPFRAMCVLYAFMRVTDDIGDNQCEPLDARRQKLDRWRDSLARALNGSPFDHVVFPALAEVVRRYEIPHEYLFELIEGVRADLNFRAFESFDELSRYCYRVAGVVGLCCIHVWGYHDNRALSGAVDCGLAFQLTNILRDLGEDADMGRVYLPREDLQRFDCTLEDLSSRRPGGEFRRLMQFEVERAKDYYQRAERLFDYLDPQGRPIYACMLRIYGGLLREIERRDYDVFSTRIALPTWRKLLIAGDAVVRHRWLKRLSR